MKEWKQIKAKAYKWRWLSDNAINWHYSYAALLKWGNDYLVMISYRLRYTKGYEFAFDEKLRAMKHYEAFLTALELDMGKKYSAFKKDTETIDYYGALETDKLISYGYCEPDSQNHPREDNKGIAQFYLDEAKEERNANKAIFIPRLILTLKPPVEFNKEIKYEEYEQMKLI